MIMIWKMIPMAAMILMDDDSDDCGGGSDGI